MDGSIYGEGLYSAGLYSWFSDWMAIATCPPVMVRESYVAPPTANWARIECQPVMVR
jgi:hypothetical protein